MKRRLTRHTKTGLFGGTFDPVHLGHLNLVENLHKQGFVEEVIFVPARIPPHKLNAQITPANHRIAMLSRALENFGYVHISNFEIERARISYTIDTARYFSKYFGDNLYLLIGMDSLRELNTWHQAKRLVEENNFIVYRRPGNLRPDKLRLNTYFGTSNACKLYDSIVDGVVKDVRSSMIRCGIGEGKDVSRFLPLKVANYINDNKLYIE